MTRSGCREYKELIYEALRRLYNIETKCSECGGVEKLELHHKIQIRNNGKNILDNIKIVCFNCHRKSRKVIITKYKDRKEYRRIYARGYWRWMKENEPERYRKHLEKMKIYIRTPRYRIQYRKLHPNKRKKKNKQCIQVRLLFAQINKEAHNQKLLLNDEYYRDRILFESKFKNEWIVYRK